MPGPDRLSKRRSSNGALFEREPESMRSLQTEVEITVERQVDGNRRSVRRKFSQPKPMLRSAERHDGMPPIRRFAKLAACEVGEINPVRTGRGRADRRADSQHGRQRLRRPEHSLFVERLVRISCETSVPTSAGSDPSRWVCCS